MKRIDIVIPLSYEEFQRKLRMLTRPATIMNRPQPANSFRWIPIKGSIYSKLKKTRLLLYSPGRSGKYKVPVTLILRAKLKAQTNNSIRITGKPGPPKSIYGPFFFILIFCIFNYTVIGLWLTALVMFGVCSLVSFIGSKSCKKGNRMLIEWLQNIHLSDTDTGGFEKP